MAGSRDEQDRREGIHEVVRRETDTALDIVRTDIANLERLYTAQQEKTIDNSYEVRRAKEILEGLKGHIEDLDLAVTKLRDSVSDLPLIRKIVYYPAGLILTAFILWLLSKTGWGVSK